MRHAHGGDDPAPERLDWCGVPGHLDAQGRTRRLGGGVHPAHAEDRDNGNRDQQCSHHALRWRSSVLDAANLGTRLAGANPSSSTMTIQRAVRFPHHAEIMSRERTRSSWGDGSCPPFERKVDLPQDGRRIAVKPPQPWGRRSPQGQTCVRPRQALGLHGQRRFPETEVPTGRSRCAATEGCP